MPTEDNDELSDSDENRLPIFIYIALLSIAAVIGLFLAFELNTWQIVVLPLVPPGLIVIYVVFFMMD